MQPRHLFAILIIMMLFGSAYPAGKLGVEHFPPFFFAALRSIILAAVLLPFFRLRLPEAAQRPALWGFCLSMGVGVYASMYLALQLTSTVAPMVIGTQLSVPFAVLLGWLSLGERVRFATLAAIASAFAGIVVVAFEPAVFQDIGALTAIAVSAFFYALATTFARSLRTVSPFAMNGWMAVTAIAPLMALSLVAESGQVAAIMSAGALEWSMLLHSAIAISLVAHVWMFSLYRHYPVATVIPYYVLMPIFGIVMSLAIFAEQPSLQVMLGGAVVIASTYAVNRTTARSVPAARPAPSAASQ